MVEKISQLGTAFKIITPISITRVGEKQNPTQHPMPFTEW
jgi:hypothetical protein